MYQSGADHTAAGLDVLELLGKGRNLSNVVGLGVYALDKLMSFQNESKEKKSSNKSHGSSSNQNKTKGGSKSAKGSIKATNIKLE